MDEIIFGELSKYGNFSEMIDVVQEKYFAINLEDVAKLLKEDFKRIEKGYRTMWAEAFKYASRFQEKADDIEEKIYKATCFDAYKTLFSFA